VDRTLTAGALAETLRNAMRQMSATLDPIEVLSRLRAALSAALAAEHSRLVVIDDSKILISDGLGGIPPVRHEADPALTRLLDADEPVIGTSWTNLPYTLADVPAQSWLAIPLRTRDAQVGLVLLATTEPGAFGPTEAQICATLAEQGMAIYDNARLTATVARLATIDPLTGLNNRRHFFDLAQREFALARRQATPLAVMMLNIDQLKRVNDRYGHAVGDQVIATIGTRLASAARGTDVLGRYGGKEYAMILPHTGPEGLGGFAERLRAAIVGRPVDSDAGLLAVTVSLGVAHLIDSDLGPSDVLNRADIALHQAKQAGRNRVVTQPYEVPAA
jgi:diguanylate cyclase (GGDEF)-like protein